MPTHPYHHKPRPPIEILPIGTGYTIRAGFDDVEFCETFPVLVEALRDILADAGHLYGEEDFPLPVTETDLEETQFQNP